MENELIILPNRNSLKETNLEETFSENFSSIGEFLSSLKPDPAGESQSTKHGKWNGTKTFDDAIYLAKNGWHDQVKEISKLSGRIISDIGGRIKREEWIPDIEGPIIDIGRALNGEPECFLRHDYIETEVGISLRHVKILANGSTSAGVDTSVMIARGSAIVALAEVLELSGFSVSVDLIFPIVNREHNKLMSTYITVKPSSERVELSMLAFWLANPSVLRRLIFGKWESLSNDLRSTFGINNYEYYGIPCDPMKIVKANNTNVYLPSAYLTSEPWMSLEATNKMIQDSLTKLGVQFEKELVI